MKKMFAAAVAVGALLTGLSTLQAQEGHPVKGSWVGMWEDNEAHGRSLLVILNWDGEEISGIINPGTDNISITDAELDPADWQLRIEADHIEEGEHYQYALVGTISDIEQARRTIRGTWHNGSDSGNFEITRQ